MKTPLFDRHVALGARIVPFAGWDMPVQYQGILPEHEATRKACAVFDICHMGEFELSGPTARADLERLLTMSVGTLRDGQCRYGYLLNESGGVLDDLTCYRRADDRYMLVVNAGTLPGDREWIRNRLSATTVFRDLSDDTGKLDVQGPASRAAMEKAFGLRLPDLGYFRFADLALDGIPCTLSRTGYTGEWGYEVYCPAEATGRLWDRLLAAGVPPAGLGARDTLRLEMGYPLYGHELNDRMTPVPCARGAFIAWDKEFVGKAACERDRARGVPRVLVGLRLESKRAARSDDPVQADGREAGRVTSGSLAPSLGVAVALAYVDTPLAELGRKLAIAVHGRPLPATVCEVPFYRHGTARNKTA